MPIQVLFKKKKILIYNNFVILLSYNNSSNNVYFQKWLKRLFHPNIKMLSLFTHQTYMTIYFSRNVSNKTVLVPIDYYIFESESEV